MKKINLLTVILLFLVILFRNNILIFFNNIYNLLLERNNYSKAEILVLEEKVKYLENEYNKLNDFKENISKYANYNYLVSRVIYKENYFYNSKIIIERGSDDGVISGMAVINDLGLVGIIGEVDKTTCELILLTNAKNLSVNIGNYFGKLEYDGKYLNVKDISREAIINLNDEVYTSTLGNIKEKLYIGRVINLEDKTISKEIIIESSVDFNNLNYLLIIGDL